VDFTTASRPALIYIFKFPDFTRRVHMEQVTHRVPCTDAAWMGSVLLRLSPDQIRDAFRAAGYKPEEIDAFTKVIQGRIVELSRL
jgi:hypothetical protein